MKALQMAGQKSFKIFLEDSKYPLYSCIAKNNKDCVASFKEFAENITANNGDDDNIYNLVIARDTTGKINNVHSSIYFKFYKDKAKKSVNNVIAGGGNFADFMSVIGKAKEMFLPMAKIEAENQLLKREIEELEKEPTENESIGNTILNAIVPALINKQPQAPAIAGTDTAEPVALNNELLTEALQILAHHDPELDKDLYKLAQMAQTNTTQFNTLINMLRNFK